MNLSPAAKKKNPSKIHQKCKQEKIKDKGSKGELLPLWFLVHKCLCLENSLTVFSYSTFLFKVIRE